MQNIHAQKILIIDFGSQYSQLIARRVREIGVYCEIMHHSVSEQIIWDFKPAGIILSGGPETVTEAVTPRAPDSVFKQGCPVLGICYGMQTMAAQLGGEVAAAKHHEYGYAQIVLQQASQLLKGIEDGIEVNGLGFLDVWMSHGDRVTRLPEGFAVIAGTEACPIAMMENDIRHFYGIQFHPEVTHTKQGKRILERFVLDICACQPAWTSKNIIADSIRLIRNTVKQEKVLLALSGGVDSSVVAALLHEAIGDQLICVFVDTGLLRLNEAEQVKQTFAKHLGINLICVEAKEQFYTSLKGIADPEKKRKIIGNLFIEIFAQEADKIKNVKYLAQGTIYPDVIESAAVKSENAQIIKSHHNVAGLPENMMFELLEPLRELFKDEVRRVGLELGVPSEIVDRHPFPGPGLAVRILGEVKSEYVEILRQADAVFIEELRQSGYYNQVSQAFVVFLPVKSVGVMGDARKYDYVVSLRSVETMDFMTAKWSYLPHEFLAKVSNRIINEVSGISRVVYDISGKPPATIEWE